MKILLAVDGSEYTKKMVSYLTSHPEMVSPSHQYTALTVQPPLPPRARAVVGKAEVDAYYAEEADAVLNGVQALLAPAGVQPERAMLVGSAGEEIAKFADEGGFDLVIMGSHGNGSLRSMVMGSVVTKVLAASKVPLLIVR